MKSIVWAMIIMAVPALSCGVVNAANLLKAVEGSSAGVSLAKSSLYTDEVNVSDYDSGTALILNGSLNLDSLLGIDGFSIEGEYSKSRAPISYALSDVIVSNGEALFTDTLTRNYTHQAAGGYVAYEFISTSSLILKIRMGYVYSKAVDKTIITCAGNCEARLEPVKTIGGVIAKSSTQSIAGTGASLGVNLSYTFFKHLYVAIDFTRIRIHYSALDSEYGMTYIGAGVGLRL